MSVSMKDTEGLAVLRGIQGHVLATPAMADAMLGPREVCGGGLGVFWHRGTWKEAEVRTMAPHLQVDVPLHTDISVGLK